MTTPASPKANEAESNLDLLKRLMRGVDIESVKTLYRHYTGTELKSPGPFGSHQEWTEYFANFGEFVMSGMTRK